MHDLKIGWASRDVSTDKPIDIPGQFHIRVSEGVLDPITVNALVIDNGADLVVFLSADFVALHACLLNAVRDKVAKLNPAIPVNKIIMNSTHTHEGASYYENTAFSIAGMAAPAQVPHDGVEIASSDEYREFLSTRAAEAIIEAYAGRAPGGIAAKTRFTCHGFRPASASCFLTLSGLTPGLSILLIATMIGTPAALAWAMASRV